jgi:hypothetical protein
VRRRGFSRCNASRTFALYGYTDIDEDDRELSHEYTGGNCSTDLAALERVGSDGSTLRFHEVAHLSVSASAVSFDKPSCG